MCLPRFGSKNEFSLLFLIRILTKRGGLKKHLRTVNVLRFASRLQSVQPDMICGDIQK